MSLESNTGYEPSLADDVSHTQRSEPAVDVSNLVKVGQKEGSNEGGWYQDSDTGNRWYLKFYRDPNQGKMEVIANSVYRKLGLYAPQSQVVIMDGREAVASPEIIGHRRVSPEDMANNPQVKNGFIADAFLANWDVVGLVYDNIEADQDGNMYRIDNGGVLTFRAQGLPKPYSLDTIGEIDSLRNPWINAQSSSVFNNLTGEDLTAQALSLVQNLSPEDIDVIIDQSSLSSELSQSIKSAMKGRREYLINRFNLHDYVNNQADSTKEHSDFPDISPFERESVVEFYQKPERSTYSTVSFETSPQGDLLNPGKRIIFKIPEEYEKRIIRDVILKHRKDHKYASPGSGWDPEGAYSRVLVRTPDGNWVAWADPKGYSSDKFAELRSASDPENEVLHDWIATVGLVNPTLVSVENVGHGENAISNIHGLEIIFFPDSNVEYDQQIFSEGTSFIDPDNGIMLPKYGGGKKYNGTYPNAIALKNYPVHPDNISTSNQENNGPYYLDSSGNLHIRLEPGKKLVGLEISVGDLHPDGVINKQGGIGTLGWAKIYCKIQSSIDDNSKSQYFMKNVNVPPAGVLAGGPDQGKHDVQPGDEIIIESRNDTAYLMGYRIAYAGE